MPPLPPRYKSIEQSLPQFWFAPGRNFVTKRKHVKKDGALSFTSLSKMIGQRWKVINDVTKRYVEDISRILKKRHLQLQNLVESRNAGDLAAVIARRKSSVKKISRATSKATAGQHQDMLRASAATRLPWHQQQLAAMMNDGGDGNDRLWERMLHYEIQQRVELLRRMSDGNSVNNGEQQCYGQQRIDDNSSNVNNSNINYGQQPSYGRRQRMPDSNIICGQGYVDLPSYGQTTHLPSEQARVVHCQPQQCSDQSLHQEQQPLNDFVMQMMNHLRQQPPGDQRADGSSYQRQQAFGHHGMQYPSNHLRLQPLGSQCADRISVAASSSSSRITPTALEPTKTNPTEADADITNVMKLYKKRSRNEAAPVIPTRLSKLDLLLATAKLNLLLLEYSEMATKGKDHCQQSDDYP